MITTDTPARRSCPGSSSLRCALRARPTLGSPSPFEAMGEDLPIEVPVQPPVPPGPEPGTLRDTFRHHRRMRSPELFQDVVRVELPGGLGQDLLLPLRDHLMVAGGLIPLLPNQDRRILDVSVMKDAGPRFR